MNDNATQTWRQLLCDLLAGGVPVEQGSAGAAFRGRTSYELLAHRTVWPLDNPLVLCPNRKLGFRFMAAEAAWVLSGSNRLDEILPYARQLGKLSDDGIFMAGAYGPPFVEQLPYVIAALNRDRWTRQAVTTIWRPRPGQGRDLPCTVALQWMIRPVDGHDTLYCIASMRSSDAWLGVPYDIHTFAMCTAYVALLLPGPVHLGNLYLTAGSQHLYALDREPAFACVWEPSGSDQSRELPRTDELLDVAPLDLGQLTAPRDLITHLWGIAERDRSKLRCDWLVETLEGEA